MHLQQGKTALVIEPNGLGVFYCLHIVLKMDISIEKKLP